MKNKILLFIALAFVLAFALNVVSATFDVSYNTSYAIWENSTFLNKTIQSVNNVNYIGYVCLSANCTQLGAQVAGLTGTAVGNIVTVHFPEQLVNASGYLIYFYKDGYIGWEKRNEVAWGNGSANGTTAYLAKKRNGFAVIDSFNIVNTANILKPIEVNITAAMGAETHSALISRKLSGLDITPYEQVNTTIIMDVLNSTGSLINRITKNVLIPYSGSKAVSFNYTFTSIGDYMVKLYSNVTDAKIINSIIYNPVSGNVSVIQQNLTNYTYAIVNNLSYSPLAPLVNQPILFTAKALANYVAANDSNNLSPISFIMNWKIYNSSNSLVYTSTMQHVNSNNGYSNYNITTSFAVPGQYTLIVDAAPNSTLGNYTKSSDPKTQIFIVGDSVNPTPNPTPNPNPTPSPIHHTQTIVEKAKSGPIDSELLVNGSGIINLSKPEAAGTNYSFIYWMLGLILLLIIIIAVIYAMKR